MKIYKTDGTIEQVDLGGKPASLKQLQEAVGGYIEMVPDSNHRAYCNEEGLLRNLPPNEMASQHFRCYLVGDVVELEKGERV